MRDFLNYNRSKRLSNITKTRFFQIMVHVMIITFFSGVYFSKENTFSFEIPIFLLIIIAIMQVMSKHTREEITFTGIYPINYKKRVLYDILYYIVTVLFMFLVFTIYVILMFLFFYLFKNSAITDGMDENNVSLYTSIFSWGFVFSYGIFTFMIGYIKEDRKWWLAMIIGSVIYLIINSLTLIITTGAFNIFGPIYKVRFDIANYQWWFYAIVSIIYIISGVLMYLQAMRLNKPIKKIN